MNGKCRCSYYFQWETYAIRLKCLFRFCLMEIDLCESQSIRNRLEISVSNTVISSISNFGDKGLPRCVSHGSENSWDICPKSSRTRQKRSGSCLPVFAIIRMDNEVIPDQFWLPTSPRSAPNIDFENSWDMVSQLFLCFGAWKVVLPKNPYGFH